MFGGFSPYVLNFEKQTALRAPIENNVPGGAKGRICPLIRRKIESSSSTVAGAYFFLNENAVSINRDKEYVDNSHLECQGCN